MQFDNPARRLETIEFTELHSNDQPALTDFDAAIESAASEATLKLDDLVVAGDRVAICVPRALPQARGILEAMIGRLSKLKLSGIDLVFASGTDERLPAWAESTFGDDVDVCLHDGQKRSEVSFIAADPDANPLYLCNRLVEADCVIPIEISRSVSVSAGASWIYPTLADTDAQTRGYRSLASGLEPGQALPEDPMSDVDSLDTSKEDSADSFSALPDIPWHLGVMFWIQAIVNDDGNVCEIRGRFRNEPMDTRDAFAAGAVVDAADELYDLVIASMDGDASEHDIEDLLRAARNASRWLADGGTLVIATALSSFPIQPERLESIEPHDQELAAAETSGDRTEASPFLPVNRVLELGRQWRELVDSTRVVLYGDDNVAGWAEPWELTVLAGDEDLRRLARGMRSIAVVRSSQHFQDPRLPRLAVEPSC